jgi:hypothetical protein
MARIFGAAPPLPPRPVASLVFPAKDDFWHRLMTHRSLQQSIAKTQLSPYPAHCWSTGDRVGAALVEGACETLGLAEDDGLEEGAPDGAELAEGDIEGSSWANSTWHNPISSNDKSCSDCFIFKPRRQGTRTRKVSWYSYVYVCVVSVGCFHEYLAWRNAAFLLFFQHSGLPLKMSRSAIALSFAIFLLYCVRWPFEQWWEQLGSVWHSASCVCSSQHPLGGRWGVGAMDYDVYSIRWMGCASFIILSSQVNIK